MAARAMPIPPPVPVVLAEAEAQALRACLAVGQSSLADHRKAQVHALMGHLLRCCTALAEAVARADSRSNGG